jgi:polar amino acid transport system substrate-binding protein
MEGSVMDFKRIFGQALIATTSVLYLSVVHAQDAGESSMARILKTKVLRVGAIPNAAPYYQQNATSGKWEGFGTEFAEGFAQKLGVAIEYVPTTWGNAAADIQANKIDAMFAMTATPARRQLVNFSDTLFHNTYTLICRKDYAPQTWAELNAPNVKIAVDIRSSHDQIATQALPNADVRRLENMATATQALADRSVDCQIFAILLAPPVLAKNPALGALVTPKPAQTALSSIGVRKEADASLQLALNGWLQEVRQQGDVRGVILRNMEKLTGVPPSAFPADIKF